VMGVKEFPKTAYGCLHYFGMKIHKVSLSKEEAEKLWDEFDTNKKGTLNREKDAEKIDQIFSRIGDAFTTQLFQVNSAAVEEAKQKVPSGNSRELKKFNKNVEKAKTIIKTEITSKSCVAHFLRAAKLSSSGRISKDHFVVTLVEGAEFEREGLKWLNFNKYTGPIIPPRESKMIPTATTASSSNSSSTPSTPEQPQERKLLPEEQFRRSKMQIALKPDKRKDQKKRHSKEPRTTQQPRSTKQINETPEKKKRSLTDQKIAEAPEEEERVAALQAEKDRLTQQLDSLKQQAAQVDTVEGPPGS